MTPDWLIALAASFVVVVLAEMGDKTQLIAFSLASRYQRPWVVMLGILIATIANHALASWLGAWIATAVPESMLAWASASASSPSACGRSSLTVRKHRRAGAGGVRCSRRP